MASVPSTCCWYSVSKSCPTLFNPTDYSTPGFFVLHQLPELAQTHILWVGDAIQPSHPLLSPSPPTLNLSQHQGLFQWACSSHEVAKVLEFQLQHQSFQWIFKADFLYNWLVWSPCSPRGSQVSSPTPQFKSINSLVLNFLCGSTLTSIHDHRKHYSLDYADLCQQVMPLLFNTLSWIFWKRWAYQTTWPASWETCIQVRKQQLELDMEQQTSSK